MTQGWDGALSLGVEQLDLDHRQIVRRLQQIEGELAAGRLEEARASLRALHGLLIEHWSTEERWMAETGYPGLPEHRLSHAGFVDALVCAREDADHAPPQARGSVGRLAAALQAHMLAEDAALARFVASRPR